MFQRIACYSLLSFLLFSCKTEKKSTPIEDSSQGTYFSVKHFAVDQWNTYRGQPYGMVKLVDMDGKTDSSMLNAYSMDWGAVFKVFFDADISDPKYVGRYRFDMFEDNATTTRNFYYEALEEHLFTKKFQVSADQFTDKVRSIYIETEKKSKWGTVTQKLLYIPMKTISIQEFEWSTGGAHKDMHIEYKFL